MVRQIRLCILVLGYFGFSQANSQNNYFVTFTDKLNTPYSINAPVDFLSDRAISRRNRFDIAVNEEDLPVDPVYLNGVQDVGTTSVREVSKWLNGAIIQASPIDAEAVKLLPFVTAVDYIAPGNVGGRLSKKLDLEDDYTYSSDTLFQFDLLGVSEMRHDGFQGENMLIAIMDGGFEGLPAVAAFSHLYANNHLWLTYDFISRTNNVAQYTDHGTKVLSIIAAKQDAPEYVGIAPNANFLLFITEDIAIEYKLEEYHWLVAAEKADSAGADVINSSLGYNYFSDPLMNYTIADLDGNTAIITRAAQKAAEKGILVVTSGGNTGSTDPWENVLFPADVKDGLAIGSIELNYAPSIFSPIGPTADGRIKPDLMAAGSNTFLINRFGNIVTGNGTSYSAPAVAALGAGLMQAFPGATPKILIEGFKTTSSNSLNPDNQLGYGVPSYTAMKNYLQSEPSSTWYSIYPNPVVGNELINIRIQDPLIDSEVRLSIFDAMGRQLDDENAKITWANNTYFVETVALPRGIYILNLQSSSNIAQFKILKL